MLCLGAAMRCWWLLGLRCLRDAPLAAARARGRGLGLALHKAVSQRRRFRVVEDESAAVEESRFCTIGLMRTVFSRKSQRGARTS